jgi:hypothetical protein
LNLSNDAQLSVEGRPWRSASAGFSAALYCLLGIETVSCRGFLPKANDGCYDSLLKRSCELQKYNTNVKRDAAKINLHFIPHTHDDVSESGGSLQA